ncbi:SAM-dependent methyltransferase [Candidatus Roizmanbacteria bacterium]|nr:SAM-dependent methyltransferase [Candidatus Roizmanbacteria bacterium]
MNNIKNRILSSNFAKAEFSGSGGKWKKVIVRPVEIRYTKMMQFSYWDGKKDITKNYFGEELLSKLDELTQEKFKKVKIRELGQGESPDLRHDRQKKYILEVGKPVPFLIALRIMSKEGKIKAKMYNKFVQINQFLKYLSEIEELKKINSRPIYLVDCGCGNAYLTLAAYHYLNNELKISTKVTGIDINGLLVKRNQEKVKKLSWANIEFVQNRIISFVPGQNPDIVLALHNCDIATDEALAQAIKWKAKIILAAPCCQHELQTQLRVKPNFEPLFRNGIIKERLSNVLTDTFRAAILRVHGYKTEVVEFIDSKHTPKNILIRAVKVYLEKDKNYLNEYEGLKNFWQVTPILEKLLT